MSLTRPKNWTRDELLVAFSLYCRTPFGRLHQHNPDVITLAWHINRTPSAIAMKLVNFASFDPAHKARNVSGLSNASRADSEIWNEFNADPERLIFQSQLALESLLDGATTEPILTFDIEQLLDTSLQTETNRMVRIRLVQGFFRETVLASYDYRCAICSLDLPELLIASHIIPWSQNTARRADPRNGLSLCALHDKAFDRGLLTIKPTYEICLSAKLKMERVNAVHSAAFKEIDGHALFLPKRFLPDPLALEYHRANIFLDNRL